MLGVVLFPYASYALPQVAGYAKFLLVNLKCDLSINISLCHFLSKKKKFEV